MTEIVGVRFKSVGKIYYFSPNGMQFEKGQIAVVETARGTECGEIVTANKMLDKEEWDQPLKNVLRLAGDDDIAQMKRNRENEENAFKICGEKIRQHKLEMKLIDVEYAFDNSKVLFYFTADGRVDFRELVKDLASVLKTRIELRQIGVRDEAKMLGGLGICGRPFCCSTFLGEFQPVSIRMAKEQGLSLNPAKISGTCGRLMCCLKYEQDVYKDLMRTTPRQGSTVNTPQGKGTVTEVSLVAGSLKVMLDKDNIVQQFKRDEVEQVRERTPKGDAQQRPSKGKKQKEVSDRADAADKDKTE